MKYLFSIFACLLSVSAFADSLAVTNAAQYDLNRFSPGAFSARQFGTKMMKQREYSVKCVYDFSVDGGAIGAITLKDEQGKACVLPNKAIIRDVLIDVVTAPTSLGLATIALGAGVSAVDLKAATAIAAYTGLVAGIPVGSAATAIKLSADQSPIATIAVAALTAGKLNVHILYQLSE